MSLTAAEIGLVRESLAEASHEYAPASIFFYERLFVHAPELRSMFRDDLAGQGMKFMTTLRTIAAALNDPAALTEELRDLGRFHATLGIRGAQYAPMQEALIDTFRETLGDGFTDAHEQAWRNAYEEIAKVMLAAANHTDQP